ncbi:MAG TPA: 2-phosphosulfolactate phosphatase [Cyanobacteria bacterium UBA8530]|nr:2-phosphosulfolactate phosphatase [Cyanobacteria bacterium UBA8530]
MRLSVFYGPEGVPAAGSPDCAVAIDVLRATTTIAAALGSGAEAVQVFSGVEELKTACEAWPEGKRITLGERGGDKIPGFALGNSPLELPPEILREKRVFMTTTNGTRSLERMRGTPCLLAASLVNLASLLSFLKEKAFESVWVVCSGWEGAYSLEDAFCAGAIAAGIEGALANDEAIAAAALYQQWKKEPLRLLLSSSHGQRLLKRGLLKDLAFCAQLNSLDVLPIQSEPGLFIREETRK